MRFLFVVCFFGVLGGLLSSPARASAIGQTLFQEGSLLESVSSLDSDAGLLEFVSGCSQRSEVNALVFASNNEPYGYRLGERGLSRRVYLAIDSTDVTHLVAYDTSSGTGQDLGDLGFTNVYGLVLINGSIYGFTMEGSVIELRVSLL